MRLPACLPVCLSIRALIAIVGMTASLEWLLPTMLRVAFFVFVFMGLSCFCLFIHAHFVTGIMAVK
jgi:predicted membrane channel-forming protein YqfA (hemolysin III family)